MAGRREIAIPQLEGLANPPPPSSTPTRWRRAGKGITQTRGTLVYVREPSSSQNVTLALPKKVLQRVKVIAAKRGTSISRLLVETLQHVAARDEAYERARTRALGNLKRPPNLGTRGRRTWTRDELHED